MSDSALTINRLVIERYGPDDSGHVLVLERGKTLAKGQSFDLVLVPDLLAQDPAFWDSFVDLVQLVRGGGYLCVTVPASGPCDLPGGDHWRFARDAGLALEQHAVQRGQPVQLVESFVSDGAGRDVFVAIFRRLPTDDQPPRKFVHLQVPCRNVRTWQTTALLHAHTDRDRMQDLRAEIAELAARGERREAEIERLKAREAELVALGRQRDALFRDAASPAQPKAPAVPAEAPPASPVGDAASYLAEREWLRHVHIALAAQPFWWSLMSKRWRRARERRLLQVSGLFDSAGYLARNPDVAAAGMDPLRHYIWHGMNEGRSR